MTEDMLLAAHEAAHAARNLPWREAEQERWTAVIAAMPAQNDGTRLSYALNNLGGGLLEKQFAAHVLSIGGVGDLDDFRSFIDSQNQRPHPEGVSLSAASGEPPELQLPPSQASA